MRLGDRTTGRDSKRVVYGHALLQLILAGSLKPEYRFPKRKQLAEEWGVGVQTASEALNLTCDAGCVGVVHGDRTEVLPETEWNAMHPLVVNRAHRSSPRPESFLAQYAETETGLEVGTILSLRPSAAPALIARLDAAQRRIDEAAARPRGGQPSPDWRYADSDFHGILATATGNLVTGRFSSLLRQALVFEALVRPASAADVAREAAEHRAVLARLVVGDRIGAASELRAHLDATTDRMARVARGHTFRAIEEPEFVLRGWPS